MTKMPARPAMQPGEEEEAQTAYIAALIRPEINGRVTEALEATGISMRRLLMWRENEEFVAREKYAETFREDRLDRVVWEMIFDKNPTIVAKGMGSHPKWAPKERSSNVQHDVFFHGMDQITAADEDELLGKAAHVVEMKRGVDYSDAE